MSRKSHRVQLLFAVLTSAGLMLLTHSLWHSDSKDPISVDVKAQKENEDCDLIDFRYLIVSDDRFTPKSRDIFVFMDKKLFTKENLTKLFARLAPKYTDAKILSIVVITDWEQFRDCAATGRGGTDQKPSDPNLLEARYYRDENREHFTYIPEPGKDYVKVDLKRK
ncbi:MAG: hypothetical protein IPN69_05160 [Acidobacteria bacterium]|nr:hypothetical protein [Acidobacteriota bacterium]MBK8810105.1 hypothetical protein [Acidobacteriota bacterium]